MLELADLPAAGLIEKGLRSLEHGETNAASLLVAVAFERFVRLGLLDPNIEPPEKPEEALYALLSVDEHDPYYRYNALLAELDSFLSCAERRARPPR